jgi:phosphocarrier protein
MTEITYTLTDPLGLHARPAGQLVKMAAKFTGKIRIGAGDRMVDAKRIIGVMGLTLKKDDKITMTFEGEDETAAAAACKAFLEEKL